MDEICCVDSRTKRAHAAVLTWWDSDIVWHLKPFSSRHCFEHIWQYLKERAARGKVRGEEAALRSTIPHTLSNLSSFIQLRVAHSQLFPSHTTYHRSFCSPLALIRLPMALAVMNPCFGMVDTPQNQRHDARTPTHTLGHSLSNPAVLENLFILGSFCRF